MHITEAELENRFRTAKKLFSEDECAPDAETLDQAWVRLFGEKRPDVPLAIADGGDAILYLYPHGRMAQFGPPQGGWTEIRVTEEKPKGA